jgi:hypothetical protein
MGGKGENMLKQAPDENSNKTKKVIRKIILVTARKKNAR